MAIVKNKMNTLHHVRRPYTNILNSTLNLIKDKSALAVFVYLSSKPEDWIVQKTEVAAHFNCGRDSILKAFSYLKSLGLYASIPRKDETGKITNWEICLYEDPELNPHHQNTENAICGEIEAKAAPDKGFVQTTENPRSDKSPPLQKKEVLQKKETNKDIYIAEPEIEQERYKGDVTPFEAHQKQKTQPVVNQLVSNTGNIAIQYSLNEDDLATFEQFTNLYPIKASNQKCAHAWFSSKCHENSPHIFERLSMQIAQDRRFRTKQYTPSPLNYIQGEMWNDEIVPHAEQAKKSSAQQKEREYTENLYSTDWAKW